MYEAIKRMEEAMNALPFSMSKFKTDKKRGPYGVWTVSGGGDALVGDNTIQDQIINGYVDYFTKQDDDGNVELIVKAFQEAGIAFSLQDVMYENETGFMHWVWTWEVV